MQRLANPLILVPLLANRSQYCQSTPIFLGIDKGIILFQIIKQQVALIALGCRAFFKIQHTKSD